MNLRLATPLLMMFGFGLVACEPYVSPNDPYGSSAAQAPRYGHGGTHSPNDPGTTWEQQQARQQEEQRQLAENQMGDPDGMASVDGDAMAATDQDPTGGATMDNRGERGGAGGGGSNQAAGGNTASSGGKAKYGTPVPGKPGFLYSPHNPNGGYIDIRVENPDGSMGTLPPGTKIKDPFSSEPILVP
ncbi:MAG: hypothetical protein AAGD22_16675 [Verrucomicrobiota bacterium]